MTRASLRAGAHFEPVDDWGELPTEVRDAVGLHVPALRDRDA